MFFKLLKNLLIGLFFIPLFSFGQVEFLSVCDRTPQVRVAIMEKVNAIDSSIECGDADLIPLLLSEIKTLNLTGKNIISLKAGDFSGLSDLRRLTIAINENLEALPVGIFSGLYSLKYLNLEQNNIRSLVPGTFSDLSAVIHLLLNRNRIESLPAGSFTGLSSVTYLNLSRNRIRNSLVPGSFSGLSSLKELDLHWNEISSLAPGTFFQIPASLIYLSLSGNKIESLPGTFFSNLRSLELLSINENPLDEQTKLRLRTFFQRDGRSESDLYL